MGKALEKFAMVGAMIPILTERERDMNKRYIHNKYQNMSKKEKQKKLDQPKRVRTYVGGSLGTGLGVGSLAYGYGKTAEGIKRRYANRDKRHKEYFGRNPYSESDAKAEKML